MVAPCERDCRSGEDGCKNKNKTFSVHDDLSINTAKQIHDGHDGSCTVAVSHTNHRQRKQQEIPMQSYRLLVSVFVSVILLGAVAAILHLQRNHNTGSGRRNRVDDSQIFLASNHFMEFTSVFGGSIDHNDVHFKVEEENGAMESPPPPPAAAGGGGGRGNVIPTKFLGMNAYGDPVYMPLIGTGTWQYNDTIAYESVCKAFEVGYTFVDTAFGYRNQRGVGKAIRECWKKPREDLFVLTKIPGGLNTSEVHAAHQRNLLELGLDYVDHLMTHFPSDWEETTASQAARQEEWLALEAIYKSGEARTIGISHYCSRHILDIMWVATVTPALNQVEYHIGSQDVDNVIDTCADLGITFMSFSPLCGPCQLDDPSDSLIHGDLVMDVAAHYDNVSGSQVSLRYIVQQGIPVIPKSNSLEHIRSNFDIFGFELSEVDMKRLEEATKPAAEGGDCDVTETTAMSIS
mmetsp:Transcript_57232/g.139546  ORF Transcript_57232/g.139546 Transcript_57232/m.139546 type:complete len:461 (+) Transcript_57232:115-1497(+)|eukprot:CAMPEP_0113456658 /NCGR_PEP_ID=MMETSP0014_2-20120614/9002_1 /TAXON_ID=2857 /ORGANISM="Nitzschia sp." /LENGTH=460 /DNA_ID=CAMNT_0000348121 /DNA_START=856 /DNA_END=2238 /DNA_ORIENTATION=+ /assembly_acc=CAM_ASM_000159